LSHFEEDNDFVVQSEPNFEKLLMKLFVSMMNTLLTSSLSSRSLCRETIDFPNLVGKYLPDQNPFFIAFQIKPIWVKGCDTIQTRGERRMKTGSQLAIVHHGFPLRNAKSRK